MYSSFTFSPGAQTHRWGGGVQGETIRACVIKDLRAGCKSANEWDSLVADAGGNGGGEVQSGILWWFPGDAREKTVSARRRGGEEEQRWPLGHTRARYLSPREPVAVFEMSVESAAGLTLRGGNAGAGA